MIKFLVEISQGQGAQYYPLQLLYFVALSLRFNKVQSCNSFRMDIPTKSTGSEMTGAFVYTRAFRGEKGIWISAKETPCRTVLLRGKNQRV